MFRAGTLGTIKDKTAYGYIKKYYETRGEPKRTAFIEGLIPKLAGVKRTTGQHPGGIVVIPRNLDVHYITPVSYPADDPSCAPSPPITISTPLTNGSSSWISWATMILR